MSTSPSVSLATECFQNQPCSAILMLFIPPDLWRPESVLGASRYKVTDHVCDLFSDPRDSYSPHRVLAIIRWPTPTPLKVIR